MSKQMQPDEIQLIRKAKSIILRYARNSCRAFIDPAVVKDYLLCANAVNEASTGREQFRALFVDSQHRLIKDEILFEGTIDAAPVYPRVVVKSALDCNAAAVILAHNHPSGLAEPSQADRNITKRLKEALEMVDIRVLDHFVIGGDSIVSFAERGIL